MTDLPTNARHPGWRLEDIAFDTVDVASVREDEFLFLTLTSASFVEILADMYSGNLIEHFRGNTEVTNWLSDFWQREEVQHGRALKAYVQTVWPEFDWERAHSAFRMEYSSLCTAEQLESHRALELMARCVVETGTSTFYRALQDYVREPVLCQLLANISADETAHYNHFRRYFASTNIIERHGVGAMVATIWRRLREIRNEDSYIAFKHVHAGRYSPQQFRESDWRCYNKTVKRLARRHYPYSMAVRMLIKPIPIFKSLRRILEWPLVGLAVLISLG